jgi:hypothetical protein
MALRKLVLLPCSGGKWEGGIPTLLGPLDRASLYRASLDHWTHWSSLNHWAHWSSD